MDTEFSIFPALETARLSLRRLSLADAQSIYELRSDPVVAKLTGKEPFTSINDAIAYIQKIERLFKEHACIFWAISFKGESALIGAICFWNYDRDNSSVEIGYELLPKFQKKGIMEEGLAAGINFGFKNMKAATITAFPSVHNFASVKVLEKLKFRLVPNTLPHNHENVEGMLTYVLYNLHNNNPGHISEPYRPTILQSVTKIRFQDCDPFNHLYNTRYLDYFLNAREDQLLSAYNLDVFRDMHYSGLVWVVSSNQICYLKPACMGESIIIDSQLIEATPRSLTVEMRMWDEEKANLKSILWTKFIYFNLKTRKPALHSEELSKLFNEIHLPVEQDNFDDRKNYLVRQNR